MNNKQEQYLIERLMGSCTNENLTEKSEIVNLDSSTKASISPSGDTVRIEQYSNMVYLTKKDLSKLTKVKADTDIDSSTKASPTDNKNVIRIEQYNHKIFLEVKDIKKLIGLKGWKA